jgi:hypothetical protein
VGEYRAAVSMRSIPRVFNRSRRGLHLFRRGEASADHRAAEQGIWSRHGPPVVSFVYGVTGSIDDICRIGFVSYTSPLPPSF